jgi:hypothetical protein
MKKSGIMALAAVLGSSLLAGVGFTLHAQGDSPILVSSASLHIQSAVAWSQWGQGNTRSHPDRNRSVPSIDVTVGTKSQTLNIGGQRCQVSLQYGKTTLTFATGANGKGITFRTDFSQFRQVDDTHMDHTDPNQKITSITVTRAGTNVFQSNPNGAVRMVIHYQ